MTERFGWAPAVVLVLGVVGVQATEAQRRLPLQTPLEQAIPGTIGRFSGEDITLSEAERRAVGVSGYLLRGYASPDSAFFSLYVGFYDRQVGRGTIHSPRNCLPGAGWEALSASTVEIAGPYGPATVNQYLVRNGDRQALVLYWYQGRGRLVSSEYRAKWNLLRDKALRRRSDEALVRIVVPITRSPADALAEAKRVGTRIASDLRRSLPG